MKRLGLAVLLLSCVPARADDDSVSAAAGLFGSVLKKAAKKATGRDISINDKNVQKVIKTGQAFRKSAEEFTETEEYFIGRSVAAKVLARYKPYEDESLNRYVQAVAQAAAMASDRPEISKGYHAQVLDSGELNALSAPGGFIFITTGLLKRLKDEDELACVLAHEVAHISKKHGLKTIKASRLTKAFELLGAEVAEGRAPERLTQLTKAFDGTIDDVVENLVVSGYSRDKEFEADRAGAGTARDANYDPQALSRFIAGLGTGQGGLLKTHPSAKQRLKELESAGLEPSADYQDAAARRKRFSAALAKLPL